MIPPSHSLCVAGALATFSGIVLLLAGSGPRKRNSGTVGTALGLATALAAFAGTAWLFGAWFWLGAPFAAMSLAWLGFAALRCGILERLARLATHPATQAVLLVIGGFGLIAWGSMRLDCDLNDEVSDSEKAMAAIKSPMEFVTKPGRSGQTDAGRKVALKSPKPESVEDLASFPEADYLRMHRMDGHLIQTGPIDGRYNCHGWVFAAGRSWIGGTEVPIILMDNGYQEVKKPAIGDVAVFTDSKGEVTHTGLVCGMCGEGTVLLESKWGTLGRYIHTATHHIYLRSSVKYYRTDRSSHTLAGMPSDPGDEAAQ